MLDATSSSCSTEESYSVTNKRTYDVLHMRRTLSNKITSVYLRGGVEEESGCAL